jgi:hypothetical protein
MDRQTYRDCFSIMFAPSRITLSAKLPCTHIVLDAFDRMCIIISSTQTFQEVSSMKRIFFMVLFVCSLPCFVGALRADQMTPEEC